MNGHIIFCLKEQQDDAKLQTSLPGSISPTGVGGEASRGASLSRLGHSMKYVHAIDLGNPHPCWNLRVSGGRLQTPNFIARIDSGIAETHRHIGNISLEELRTVGPQGNVVTPRTGHVLMKAAMLRNHVSHLDGYGQEVLVSPETRNELLRLADQELEFERVRRVAGGNLVSRISCLWLAERNEQGISHVRSMLGDHVYFLDVAITCNLALTRTDTSWFDAYWNEPREEFAQGYWSQSPFGNTPNWEYLLDGEIVVENPEQLAHVINNGNIQW